MIVIGVMMLVVGIVLLLGAANIYRNGKKDIEMYKDRPSDNDHFLMLLNNGMIVLRIIGGLLMVMGLIFIFIH